MFYTILGEKSEIIHFNNLETANRHYKYLKKQFLEILKLNKELKLELSKEDYRTEYLQRYINNKIFKIEDYLTNKGLDNKLIEKITIDFKNMLLKEVTKC